MSSPFLKWAFRLGYCRRLYTRTTSPSASEFSSGPVRRFLKKGRGGVLLLTTNPTKDLYPERPSRVRDLSCAPADDSCPEQSSEVREITSPRVSANGACPDPVGAP